LNKTMSFLLTSESGAQTGWTHFAWPMVRKLAQDFGWQPCGTEPPASWNPEPEKDGAWDGRYTSNDGQWVTTQDALALGKALEAALAADDFEQRIRGLSRGAMEQLRSPGLSVTQDVDLSAWRKGIEEFARFCRKGRFRIS
jgi:hypothetical protein